MRTWLSFYRQMFFNLLMTRLDEGEVGATSPTPTGGRKLPAWAIILIVVVGVAACVGLACLLIPVILTLMGPSIGNVFSNIIEELATPTP
jgi:hypothetical protein